MLKIFVTKLCILTGRNLWKCVKKSIRTEYLTEQKPRGVLAGKQAQKSRRRERIEEVSSYRSVFLKDRLGNLKSKKPPLVGPCCSSEQ